MAGRGFAAALVGHGRMKTASSRINGKELRNGSACLINGNPAIPGLLLFKTRSLVDRADDAFNEPIHAEQSLSEGTMPVGTRSTPF